MLQIQITHYYDKIQINYSQIKKLAQYTLERFKIQTAQVSIVITDDEQISNLNFRYKQKKQTTDCLSFDLSDHQDTEAGKLFEIIVNGKMAKRQAELRKHSAQAELALYITHGLLHQLGFDDQTAENAEKMHAVEDEILQHIGFGIVYND